MLDFNLYPSKFLVPLFFFFSILLSSGFSCSSSLLFALPSSTPLYTSIASPAPLNATTSTTTMKPSSRSTRSQSTASSPSTLYSSSFPLAQRIVRLQSSSQGCHLLGGTVEREVLRLHEDFSSFLSHREKSGDTSAPSSSSASSSYSSSLSKQSKMGRKQSSGTETLWVAHLAVCTPGVGISVNENADPTVRRDMKKVLDLLTEQATPLPPRFAWPLLVGQSISIPFSSSRGMLLGTWQGVYIIDGRGRHDEKGRAGEDVEVVITLLPVLHRVQRTVTAQRRGCEDLRKEIDTFLSAVQDAVKSQRQGGKRGYQRSDSDDFDDSSRQDSGWGIPLLMHIWTQHTSCSLSVLPSNSLRDVEPVMSSVVPESWNNKYFQHTYEGPDDMPAHAKTTLFSPEVMLPLRLLGSSPRLDCRLHEEAEKEKQRAIAAHGHHEASRQERDKGLTEGKGLTADDFLLTVDFCKDQTAALNEHRDTGGWGGGHSRKLVLSAVGSDTMTSSGTTEDGGKKENLVIWRRETVKVDITRQTVEEGASLGASIQQVFGRSLSGTDLGVIHCFARAVNAAIAIVSKGDTDGSMVSSTCSDTSASTRQQGGTEDKGQGPQLARLLRAVLPASYADKERNDRSALLSSVRAALLGSGVVVPVRKGKLHLPALHGVHLFLNHDAAAFAERQPRGSAAQMDGSAESRTAPPVDPARTVDVICTLLGSTAFLPEE